LIVTMTVSAADTRYGSKNRRVPSRTSARRGMQAVRAGVLTGITSATGCSTGIGCAACIDACDHVMEKAGMPKGLIRYSTERALDEHYAARGIWGPAAAARDGYTGILAAPRGPGGCGQLRVPLNDVIRDRGAPRARPKTGAWRTRSPEVRTGERSACAVSASGFGWIASEPPSTPVIDGVPCAAARPDVPAGSNKITVKSPTADRGEKKAVFLGIRP
jgi:hypothetical protein